MSNNGTEGILFNEKGKAVPLTGVDVDVKIVGRGAKVNVAQRFFNREKKPIEAVYKFPLPENAAICGFTAFIDGRVVEGRIEEREKAFEIYDKALAEGHKAQLMDEERPNIFTLSVGNIKPQSTVIIEISYITLLDSHGRELRFCLPTTISPRYTPSSQKDREGIPESDRVNPIFVREVPYGLTINVNIHGGKSISSIESSSHTVKTSFSGDDTTITFTSEKAAMNKDFILTIVYEKDFANRAFMFRDHDETFIQVDITPDENTGKDENVKPVSKSEVVFVLDCSGSMEGESIEEAKKALEIMVRALNPDNMFNIYRFGSEFEKLYDQSKMYDENSMQKALQYISGTDASLGGTEVMLPLTDIYDKRPSDGYRRDIILITDGEVSNEDEVMKLVKKNIGTTSFSAVGIGSGPNEFLIKGASRAAGGASEMIAPNERIEPKVLRLFQKVMAGNISNLKVDCGVDIEQVPSSPFAYLQQQTSIFARVENGKIPGNFIRVTGNARQGLQEWIVNLEEIDCTDFPISKLWAREKIRELEEGNGLPRGSKQQQRGQSKKQNAIVEISRKYGVISRSTSFVGVEKRLDTEEAMPEIELRVVPSCITEGWHGGQIRYSRAPQYNQSPRYCRSLKAFSGDIDRYEDKDFHIPAFIRPSRPGLRERAMPSDHSEKDPLLEILALQKSGGGFGMDRIIADLIQASPAALEQIAEDMFMKRPFEDMREDFHKVMHKSVDEVFMNNGYLFEKSGKKLDMDYLLQEVFQNSRSALHERSNRMDVNHDECVMILVTAIVMVILETRFGQRRDEWDGIVSKSRQWLDDRMAEYRPMLEGIPLMDWTHNFVKANVRTV